MNFVLFISGIVIFIFAMKQLEDALSNLGSRSLNKALSSQTDTPVKGILLGTAATAVLQSSSLVGLITLAFVAASIIPFRNAIGIILGSNLGTTFTGWIVTIIGFKLDLAEYAFPIMAAGSMLIILADRSAKIKYAGMAFFAVGLLLVGLSLMKDGIGFITELVDINELKDMPVIFFFILGTILTAIIQSSSATMLIALSALNAGILELPMAAALIIGADLGTTSTVMIGALYGATSKKQVALVHFVFNLVTDLLALAAISFLLYLVADIYGFTDPLFSLVAIHTSFNLFGILLFLPLINRLETLALKTFPPPTESRLKIESVDYKIINAGLLAAEDDIKNLMIQTMRVNSETLAFDHSVFEDNLDDVLKQSAGTSDYNALKRAEAKITKYLISIQNSISTNAESEKVLQLLVALRDTIYAAKSIKDIRQDVEQFSEQLETGDGASHLVIHALHESYQHIVDWLKTDDIPISQLNMMFEQLSRAHGEYNKLIYQLISTGELEREAASTSFNINREILLSGHSLLNAVENLLLEPTKARTLSEVIKTER
ncbi:Na/Pi cotransporter family protein [Aliikangiella marina]|uniref:Na/Pi cotransporter family protein n=1 Tax=Aliikangiella marina TaxID=1712262 RepID=A0A545T382_9GAMM|nr:Na/Pi symporter [Aliikangiella marina]TQV71662.1 Na/Pi cotransporter family protein [Aliikangiella marina]TQV71677.1 Na/Pi cotransporter family protein [Aliikangiella marina]